MGTGTPIWPIEGIALDSTGDMVADSLADRIVGAYIEDHLETLVYPTLAAGASVSTPVAGTANWTLGAYATIVPINTVASEYHIKGITIETCDQSAVFQLELYKGAGDDIIAALRFAVVGGFWGNSVYNVSSEPVAANAQIRARLASSDGFANQATVTLSVRYHEHI